jgi:hypothetical protein
VRAAEPVEQFRRFRKRQLAEMALQQVLVEKVERFPRLLDAPQRILLALGKVLQKSADLGEPQLARMLFAAKQDEPPSPLHIALARFRSRKAGLGSLPNLIEQSWRLS